MTNSLAYYKPLAYTATALAAVLSPIYPLLFFTGFLIALDILTGVWASRKRGEVYSSEKLKNSWSKIVLYPLGIIFSYWAEFLVPEIPFLKGAALLLILIEGKSLEENFSSILGLSLMQYLRAYISKGFNKAFTDKKEVNK
jgi:hypothetical protein